MVLIFLYWEPLSMSHLISYLLVQDFREWHFGHSCTLLVAHLIGFVCTGLFSIVYTADFILGV